ncbi:GNAT family N-acetyltransferase [Aeromonas crassostreae]
MDWTLKGFDALSLHELYDLLALRSRVFVVEQSCPFLDLDGLDKHGEVLHLLGWQEGELVAYARLLAPDLVKPGFAVIGRVVTAPEARGGGLGHRLMERAGAECALLWPQAPVYLGAQAHLQDFYARHGFRPEGEAYLEDEILHIGMVRP